MNENEREEQKREKSVDRKSVEQKSVDERALMKECRRKSVDERALTEKVRDANSGAVLGRVVGRIEKCDCDLKSRGFYPTIAAIAIITEIIKIIYIIFIYKTTCWQIYPSTPLKAASITGMLSSVDLTCRYHHFAFGTINPVEPFSASTRCHCSLTQSQPIDRNMQRNTPLCCTYRLKSY